MKKTILLLAFIFSLSIGFSQTTIKDGVVVDEKAEKIINKIATKLKADSPLSISFSVIEQGVKTVGRKGEFTFSGNKYFGSFLNNRIYCDGNSIWIYQQEINEVTINSIEDAQNDILNIAKLIENANKTFRPKLIKTHKGSYTIDLTPKSKSEYTKIRLISNIKTNRVSSLEINYRTGRTYTYTISNYRAKLPLKDSDFQFDKKKYPSANIVDLR